MRIDCPHCGSSFDVQFEGEPSNMMVFCCAHCKTPLMYFHGVVSELGQEEFAKLRKRLTRVLDAALARNNGMEKIADSIRKFMEESENCVENPSAQGSSCEKAEKKLRGAISEEFLSSLQQELENLDAESFLDKL